MDASSGSFDDDPLFWNEERLGRELFKPEYWPNKAPSKIPDRAALAQSLRGQGIDGEAILKWEDLFKTSDGIFAPLEIKTWAHRISLLETIALLKTLSPAYQCWKREQRWNAGGDPPLEAGPDARTEEAPPTPPLYQENAPGIPALVSASPAPEPQTEETGSESRPPPPKRRAVLQALSSEPTRQQSLALPTMADTVLARHQTGNRHDAKISAAEDSSHYGAFIGKDGVDSDDFMNLGSGDDSDHEFSFVSPQRHAPGRRLQINRMMKSYLLRNSAREHSSADDRSETGSVLGESDDEDPYDSETEREMKEEEIEKLNYEAAASRQLTREQVQAVLDDEMARTREVWATEKFPKLLRNANRLWNAFRGRDKRNAKAAALQLEIGDFEVRIRKIIDEMLLHQWSTKDEILAQLPCIRPSIGSIEHAKWFLNLLSLAREPERHPEDSPGPPKPRNPRSVRRSYSESLDSEDDIDFLDNDDYLAPKRRAPKRLHSGYRRPSARSSLPRTAGPKTTPRPSQGAPPPSSPVAVDNEPDIIDLTLIEEEYAVDGDGNISQGPSEPAVVLGSLTPEKPSLANTGKYVCVLADDYKGFSCHEVAKIAAEGCGRWVKTRDRERLLIAMLHEIPPDDRQVICGMFSGLYKHADEDIWDGVAIPLLRRGAGEPRQLLWLFWAFCTYEVPPNPMNWDFSVVAREIEERHDVSWPRFCPTMRTLAPLFLEKLASTNSAPDDDGDGDGDDGDDDGDDDDVVMADVDADADADAVAVADAVADADADAPSEPDDVARDSGLPPSRKVPRIVDVATRSHIRTAKKRKEQAVRKVLFRALLASQLFIPSDRSRLIINESKQEGQGLIYIHAHIAARIKDHQIEGIRFMWNQLATDPSERYGGCLLAHSMGLGKTMQIITLLTAIAVSSNSPDETISSQIPHDLKQSKTLVLCPSFLVINWWNELRLWTPGQVLGNFYKIDAVTVEEARREIILEWDRLGGILLIGYDLFKEFVDPSDTSRKRIDGRVKKALVEGPNIVIADEAHKLKNPDTLVRKSADAFRTACRIALTGSPLSNSIVEYYSMIEWVAPGYLGPRKRFANRYSKPIIEGLYKDSTIHDRKYALQLLSVFTRIVAPKIHRVTIHDVGKNDLPPKKEFIISVPLTIIQQYLYRSYMERHARGELWTESGGNAKIFGILSKLALICNHPRCYLVPEDKKSKGKKHKDTPATTPPIVPMAELRPHLLGFDGCPNQDPGSPQLSYKVSMLIKIIEMSKKQKDKVLVFSHWLATLHYLEQLLQGLGYGVLKIDGQVQATRRQEIVNNFNSGKSDVFLISTPAGGVGLNISGANRVVIFDFKWNPVEEQQAVGRAFRLCQKKAVYVYRFMVGGSFEEHLHNKAIFKLQLASRVVDKMNPVLTSVKLDDIMVPYQTPERRSVCEFQGQDVVLDSLLQDETLGKAIFSIELMESFEVEDYESVLDDEDQRIAESLLEMERLRQADPEAYRRMTEQAEQAETERRTTQSQQAATQNADVPPAPGPESSPSPGAGAAQALPDMDVSANRAHPPQNCPPHLSPYRQQLPAPNGSAQVASSHQQQCPVSGSAHAFPPQQGPLTGNGQMFPNQQQQPRSGNGSLHMVPGQQRPPAPRGFPHTAPGLPRRPPENGFMQMVPGQQQWLAQDDSMHIVPGQQQQQWFAQDSPMPVVPSQQQWPAWGYYTHMYPGRQQRPPGNGSPHMSSPWNQPSSPDDSTHMFPSQLRRPPGNGSPHMSPPWNQLSSPEGFTPMILSQLQRHPINGSPHVPSPWNQLSSPDDSARMISGQLQQPVPDSSAHTVPGRQQRPPGDGSTDFFVPWQGPPPAFM